MPDPSVKKKVPTTQIDPSSFEIYFHFYDYIQNNDNNRSTKSCYTDRYFRSICTGMLHELNTSFIKQKCLTLVSKKKCLRHKSILPLSKYILIFYDYICKITIIIEAQIKRYRGPKHRYIGVNSCESLSYSSQN